VKLDLHSPAWLAVRSHVHGEIEAARKKLEVPSSISDTDIERGKIIALRGLLVWAEPPSEIKFNEFPTD